MIMMIMIIINIIIIINAHPIATAVKRCKQKKTLIDSINDFSCQSLDSITKSTHLSGSNIGIATQSSHTHFQLLSFHTNLELIIERRAFINMLDTIKAILYEEEL